MAVVNVWCGGTTSSTAVVVTKVDSGADVAVETDTDPGFSGPTSHGPVTPTADNVARVTVTGLDDSTRYHYRVVHGGVPDASFPGQFRTLPVEGSQASFTIGAASCSSGSAEPGIGAVLHSNGLSNYFVFDTIRTQGLAEDWPLFVHMGDLHYYDLGSGDHGIVGGGSLANYRRGYDDVLLQPHQHELYRNVPIAYTWDDHDWGPNNSTGDIPDRANALTAYRERVPHGALAVPGTAEPIYHSIRIGRVLIAVLDCRSESDNTAVGDSPTKTMLGDAQKAWLADLLATTTAKTLVLVSSRMWEHPTGSDTWANYSFDRDDVIAILAQPGVDGQDWLSRMCLIQGDGHTAGIVDADHQSFGGFPVFQFAPMSSSPGGGQAWKNLGSFGNHGQFGTLSFADAGDTITVTGTVWWAQVEGAEPTDLVTHQFVINVEEPPGPPPPPGPAPAPVATARIRRRLTWLGVHAVTGRIIAELPDVRGQVGRLLSAYSSHELTIPAPLAGPGHVPHPLLEQATAPIGTAIVAVVNDLPVWMGWVLIRKRGTGAEWRLATATPEAYLRRRRIRDHAFTDADRADVAAILIGDAEDPDGIGQGLGFTVVTTLTGDLISPTYVATDRTSVYAGLRELAADGLEFTVDLDWVDADKTSVRKILRIGPRIGKAAPVTPALFETTASSMFESQAGSEATYELTEDATDGRYGNHVTATAPGEGEDQPASAPAIDQAVLDGGTPIVEHLVELSSVAANQGALDLAAAAELARVRRPAEVWDIDVRLDAYPRLGVDAQLGDDVAWLLTGHGHPDGVTGQGRMIGYEVDEQEGRWRPVLLDPLGQVIS